MREMLIHFFFFFKDESETWTCRNVYVFDKILYAPCSEHCFRGGGGIKTKKQDLKNFVLTAVLEGLEQQHKVLKNEG